MGSIGEERGVTPPRSSNLVTVIENLLNSFMSVKLMYAIILWGMALKEG
jgi:hypothetical protein